jgi:hypothetical protein
VTANPLEKKEDFYLDACGLIEFSHRDANIAQYFRSIGNGKSLI